MPGAWLRLARRIGFDAFLDVWRMISDDERTRHDGGHRMPKIRDYHSYVRYQRNRYIRMLGASGAQPEQVRKLVTRHFNDTLTLEQIRRILDGEHQYNWFEPKAEAE